MGTQNKNGQEEEYSGLILENLSCGLPFRGLSQKVCKLYVFSFLKMFWIFRIYFINYLENILPLVKGISSRNFWAQAFRSKEFYTVLGVNSKWTMDDIKKNYHQLALVHHPDKNNGRESKQFLKIQEAYLVLSDSKTRLKYDMFINMSDPNFNPKEYQKNFRERFMTEQEKGELEAKKQKIDEMLKKIEKEQKELKYQQELDTRIKQQRAAQRAQEMIEKARKELVAQAEEIRQQEVRHRERLRMLQIEIAKSNENMVKGMLAKEVDLINFDTYVREFYDKNNDLYIKDYETKIKDIEAINKVFEQKRKEYEGLQGTNKERRVKFNNNESKINSFTEKNEEIAYEKVSNQGARERQAGIAGPVTVTIAFLGLIAGGSMMNG